jgi:hypothetical protein
MSKANKIAPDLTPFNVKEYVRNSNPRFYAQDERDWKREHGTLSPTAGNFHREKTFHLVSTREVYLHTKQGRKHLPRETVLRVLNRFKDADLSHLRGAGRLRAGAWFRMSACGKYKKARSEGRVCFPHGLWELVVLLSRGILPEAMDTANTRVRELGVDFRKAQQMPVNSAVYAHNRPKKHIPVKRRVSTD